MLPLKKKKVSLFLHSAPLQQTTEFVNESFLWVGSFTMNQLIRFTAPVRMIHSQIWTLKRSWATLLYYVITRTTHVGFIKIDLFIYFFFSAETSVLFRITFFIQSMDERVVGAFWTASLKLTVRKNRFWNRFGPPITRKQTVLQHSVPLQQRWVQVVPGSPSGYFAFCLIKYYSLSTWH